LPALVAIAGHVVGQWLSTDGEGLLAWIRTLGLRDGRAAGVHAPETLSNGERARVALAEAFVSDPALMVRCSLTRSTVYLDFSGFLMGVNESRLDATQIAALASARTVKGAPVCMDEALNALAQPHACAEIARARERAIANGSTIVMVSRNPTHFQACDEEVCLSCRFMKD